MHTHSITITVSSSSSSGAIITTTTTTTTRRRSSRTRWNRRRRRERAGGLLETTSGRQTHHLGAGILDHHKPRLNRLLPLGVLYLTLSPHWRDHFKIWVRRELGSAGLALRGEKSDAPQKVIVGGRGLGGRGCGLGSLHDDGDREGGAKFGALLVDEVPGATTCIIIARGYSLTCTCTCNTLMWVGT